MIRHETDRCAIGTIAQVMIPMMVEALRQTGTTETEQDLQGLVETFVMRLTGRQTIYQMMQLGEDEVRLDGDLGAHVRPDLEVRDDAAHAGSRLPSDRSAGL